MLLFISIAILHWFSRLRDRKERLGLSLRPVSYLSQNGTNSAQI